MAYDRPAALSEALDLLAGGGRAILAGGTDLYPATTAQSLAGDILDITGISTLKGVTAGPEGVRIGACATWSEVIAAPLPPAFDGLKEAAREVGARQIQNAGTVVGNLCNASPAADGVPALLGLDAEVEIASAAGGRRVALEAFVTGPRRTALAPGELVTAVHVPAAATRGASAFLKLGARKHLVISIAMVMARVEVADGRVAAAAVAVGACGPVAARLRRLEARLVGRAAGAGLMDGISDDEIVAPLAPIDDIRASASYRRAAAAELVRRAVALACERATG